MSARQRAVIAASLVSIVFAVPHVVEDFEEGLAARVGLTTPALACLLGVFLAVQVLGLIFVAAGRRSGWAITVAVGVIWVVGAFIEHGRALAAGSFRSGAPSVVWVLGLVFAQAAAAIIAWSELHRRQRG
jgi:hypothetical protein